MTKLQDKAQAQVKQMVGQMIGDDRLVQEGREQLHHSDEAEGTKNHDIRKRESGPAGPHIRTEAMREPS